MVSPLPKFFLKNKALQKDKAPFGAFSQTKKTKPKSFLPHRDVHRVAPGAYAFVVDEVDGAVLPGGGGGDGGGI